MKWIFTKALQQRAVKEGWMIFSMAHGEEVQKIDTQDDPDGAQLDTDDEAIALARAAGVPVDEAGYFLDHITEVEDE